MDIFTARSGQTSGPFDLATINAQLQSGQLLSTDLAWSEAQPVWQAVSLLEGVQLPAPRRVPPPPPPGGPTAVVPPPLPPPNWPPPGAVMPPPVHPGAFPAPGYAPPDSPPSVGAPSSLDEEVTIFEASASPLALSLKDLAIGLFTGGIWLVYALALNLTTRYKLTNQRLTLRSGLIAQHVEEVEIYRVRDVTVEQEIMGRLLGFGDVVVHASDASSPRLVLRHMPAPTRAKEQIRNAARSGRRSEGVRATEFMP